jgi:pimeloyl-ACP methyl ester carboxylesterase
LDQSACANKFCGIVESERKAFQSGGLESLRVNQVYGVYDGMARALLRPGMVELDSDGCFTGKALDAFANGNGGGLELVRADARKIGVVAGEKVCLWTPQKHPHKVRTLILKGARDTVIAGCQAEDFYRDGLKGERALVEFHGMGHAMFIPTVDTQYGKALKLVLEKFQDLPTDKFHNDAEVTKSLKLLNAELRDPRASRAGCPQ